MTSKLLQDVLPIDEPVNTFTIRQHELRQKVKLVALDLGCWWVGKRSIRLSSKFVSEVLLCLSEIELVDHVKFASSALFELADQKWV